MFTFQCCERIHVCPLSPLSLLLPPRLYPLFLVVASFLYSFPPRQTGAAVRLMGPHFEVTDCDIYTSDHGVYLGSHGSGPHNADASRY